MTTSEILAALDSGKTAVLIGAGVSRQAGIPLVSEIIPSLLEAIKVTEKYAGRYLGAGLPFEVTMQVVSSIVGLHGLLSIFEGSGPKRNHQLLARLAATGHVSAFITTNFDTLLEQATRNVGCNLDVQLEQYSSRSPNADARPKLLKVHGCLSQPDALGATISAVANQRAAQARYESLTEMLGGGAVEELLVMGYSFSDRFDITPALERLRIPIRVTVIEHCIGDSRTVLPLSSLPDFHPLRKWNGAVLWRDTDALVEELWRATQPDDPPKDYFYPHSLRESLASWICEIEGRFGASILPVLAASLFKAANLYTESNEYAEIAIEGLCRDGADGLCVVAHQILGDNFRDMGDGDRGYPYLQDALRLAHKSGDLKAKAKAINSLGIILEDKAKELDAKCESETPHGPRRKALKYYEVGRNWALETGDIEQAGKCEGNMGIALKNIASIESRRLAFRHLRAALESARTVGDPKSEARYYGMMASCIGLLGKKSIAMGLWEKALKVSRNIADHRHIAIWTANSGEDLIGVNSEEARHRINEAMRIFERLTCPREVSYCQALLRQIGD